MWTKGQIIDYAFTQIGLLGFDVSPNEKQIALQSLDMMMASWNAAGLRFGYSLPSDLGQLETDSGIPDSALEAVTLGLAVRIGPMLGKTVSPDTKAQAAMSKQALMNKIAQIPVAAFDRAAVPAGAGNRGIYADPFMPPRPAQIDVGQDHTLEI